MTGIDALLIGGRSGVGKTTVALETSVLLRDAGVAHCLVEGDLLDHVHPAPPDDPFRARITRRNLAALWANYADLGVRRLIYTNTVSILEPDLIRQAVSPTVPPRIVNVLLTATDATARQRLGGRERGSELDVHLRRSAAAAQRLEAEAPPGTVRVPTDQRTVRAIAEDVVAATGWLR
ncbi:hypothetical protein ABZ595_33475 [Streptomyces rubradiris]|uniref:hypothetical protein n=1 Tax=Streptomyces rubradiris TaxID=285531 RepID=UPI0033D6970E